MSIYEKLSKVQLALMSRDLKKTGYNKFKKYYYYTLDDLMAACTEECHREGLTFFFNFRNNEAIIRLHDWENSSESISCGLPFPELILPDEDAKNKNNILVQDLGAAVTYLKRYLLVNLFDITDVELIDRENGSDASSAETQKSSKKTTKNNSKKMNKKENTVPRNLNLQGLLDKALEKLQKKGLTNEEITAYAVKKQIERMDTFNKEELKEIYSFVNEYFDKEGSK